MSNDELLFSIGGVNLISRFETLRALAQTSSRTRPFTFRGSSKDLPVVSVKIGLPVYRIANRRTKTLQEEYLKLHSDMPQDFFDRDEDSLAVQKAQHEILLGLIEDQDLYDVFANPKVQQEEPILCTRHGVVVNGNRRLCAWRKLFGEDREKYAHFESIEVQLLPDDTDEKDINNIERELQIKPTLKADYSWHARANMICLDYKNNTIADLEKMYEMSGADIKLAIDCYAYAKEYLFSIGKPSQWSLVDKMEYAFRSIVAEKNRITALDERSVFEACAAAVLQANSDAVKGRRYNTIPQISKNIKPIIEVLRRDMLQGAEVVPMNDPLGIVTDANDLYVIERECRKPENVEKTVSIINDVLESISISNRDAQTSHALLDHLTKISTDLISIKNRDLDDRQINLPAVRNQIHSILETLNDISDWVNRHETHS